LAIVSWMTIAHWTAFHDAAELSENAGGVDNATAVIGAAVGMIAILAEPVHTHVTTILMDA
jgi:hypothetical protein